MHAAQCCRPVESSEESGANDSDSVPEDSSLTQLIYRAIEAGNASDTVRLLIMKVSYRLSISDRRPDGPTGSCNDGTCTD
jgi:hypothetical protein